MKPVCKINKNGTKEWFLNGRRHRGDGPAMEWADGSKEWYLNGRRHREEGPAVEYFNGSKEWYLNGKEITEEFHAKLTQGSIKTLPLYLESGYNEYIAERLRNETCL